MQPRYPMARGGWPAECAPPRPCHRQHGGVPNGVQQSSNPLVHLSEQLAARRDPHSLPDALAAAAAVNAVCDRIRQEPGYLCLVLQEEVPAAAALTRPQARMLHSGSSSQPPWCPPGTCAGAPPGASPARGSDRNAPGLGSGGPGRGSRPAQGGARFAGVALAPGGGARPRLRLAAGL